MPHFIDRRLNPKDKSLGNRQRFLKRCREQVIQAVDQAVRDRDLADIAKGDHVSIPTKGILEPKFRHDAKGGVRDRVFTGNKQFRPGDEIDKPLEGEGSGGKEGAADGEAEDSFQFYISREEFLDLFFEDLELPDLDKKSLKEIFSEKMSRAGYSVAGNPTNVNLLRTMRNSIGRRLALFLY